jgi:hypothetical protein
VTKPSPSFWGTPPEPNLDSSKFSENGLWIREFLHGLFETFSERDMRLAWATAVELFPVLKELDIDTTTDINTAYAKGIKLGRILKNAWSE